MIRAGSVAGLLVLAGTTLAGAPQDRNSGRVGFRELVVIDSTRVGPTGNGRRAFPVFLWYPAVPTRREPVRFGFWFDRLNQWAGTGRRDQPEVFIERAAELGGSRDSLRAGLDRLRLLPTNSVPRAAAAAGRFPLILFPDYTAPASTSVLAERLASRGFVVASLPLLGTFQRDPDLSARGLTTVALDLLAAARTVSGLPFVSQEGFGAIGVGITASGILTAHLMSPLLRSIVSLEGGITTRFEIDMIRRSPFFDPARVTAPLLAITAPHPDVNPASLDQYPYSEQLRIHYPAMGEFWFLNYGWLERFLPGIIGRPPGDPGPAFDRAVDQLGRFFDATLRRNSPVSLTLAGEAGPFTASHHPARPAAPEIRVLLDSLDAGGLAKLTALIAVRRPSDPSLLPGSRFAELINALAARGDSGWRARSAVASQWIEGHPQSARARRIAALAALAAADTAGARGHLSDALRLLPDDPDHALESESARRTLRRQLEALADRISARR